MAIIDITPQPGRYTLIDHKNGRYTLIVGKYTTTQAATDLGIQPGSVKKLCQRGVLKAERIGRDWLISPEEIERYKAARRKAGRPKKGSMQ